MIRIVEPGNSFSLSAENLSYKVANLKLKLKLRLVYLHHRYITIKIIGINFYMLQKRDPRSKCF